MYLIAGLGNPGEKYHATRHNIGFMAIDYISQKENIEIKKIKHKSIIGEGIIDGEKIILAKPQTYMNLSGESIKEISDWYKIDKEKIIIIYDDISLPIGSMRIRKKGSDGGHNGIKSIITHMNSDVFGRIKIGIGPLAPYISMPDFVLGKIEKENQEKMFQMLENTHKAVCEIIRKGYSSAMNLYNITAAMED